MSHYMVHSWYIICSAAGKRKPIQFLVEPYYKMLDRACQGKVAQYVGRAIRYVDDREWVREWFMNCHPADKT